MATHSSVLACRTPGMGEPQWAADCGVAQSRTRLSDLAAADIRKGFPNGSAVQNLPAKQEIRVQSLGQEDPLE